MATEAIPGTETPRHSVSFGEAVHSQSLGTCGSSTVQYFAKHDTVNLAEHNFLL